MFRITRRTLVIGAIVVICVPVLSLVATGWWFISSYSETETIDARAMELEFEAARARLARQEPFLEYRGLQAPVAHRNPGAPRQSIRSLRLLVYDAQAGELTRMEIPAWALQIITLGGRRRLIDGGLLGSPQEIVTLEDLERHGPGLVVDTTGAQVGRAVAASAFVGSAMLGSRFLAWTE